MTQVKAQPAVNGHSLIKGRTKSRCFKRRRIGLFVGLPPGVAKSRHLLRCVS